MLVASKNRRHRQPGTRARRRARSQTCTSDCKTCVQRRHLCAALSSHGKPRYERGHDYEVTQVVIYYTFGEDEISQRVVTDDGQGNVTDETHLFGHDGHGSVRVFQDMPGTAANIAQAFTFAAVGVSTSARGPVSPSGLGRRPDPCGVAAEVQTARSNHSG